MTEMLTAKDMQKLLQVDRSTIYRMAETGRLPAIKVGKQWRFPNERVEKWLKDQGAVPGLSMPLETSRSNTHLGEMLPLDCVQLIQDAFAETLGLMLVITDMAGQPITQVSNPTEVYTLLTESETGHDLCREEWHDLAQIPALEPKFVPGWGGILCTRALVRLGHELKGMVVAFGVAPANWPPAPATIADLAQSLQIAPLDLQPAFEAVARLSPAEQKRVLLTVQRIADILAHIANERFSLLGRLDSIAKLSSL